jgi:acyl carrier protein
MAKATTEAVRGKIAEFLHHPVAKVPDQAVLTDLVTDSMILVNMVIELQEEFSVRLVQEDLKEVKTVGQLLAVFGQKLKG